MPPPTTSRRRGISLSRRAPVESTTRGSSHGKSGSRTGFDPAAMIACSNPIRRVPPSGAATARTRGPSNRPVPCNTSTLRRFARLASPPVRRWTTPSFQESSFAASMAGASEVDPARPELRRRGHRLRGAEERLGGDTADVEADPAQGRVALDEHRAPAEVGGPERGRVAARSRARARRLPRGGPRRPGWRRRQAGPAPRSRGKPYPPAPPMRRTGRKRCARRFRPCPPASAARPAPEAPAGAGSSPERTWLRPKTGHRASPCVRRHVGRGPACRDGRRRSGALAGREAGPARGAFIAPDAGLRAFRARAPPFRLRPAPHRRRARPPAPPRRDGSGLGGGSGGVSPTSTVTRCDAVPDRHLHGESPPLRPATGRSMLALSLSRTIDGLVDPYPVARGDEDLDHLHVRRLAEVRYDDPGGVHGAHRSPVPLTVSPEPPPLAAFGADGDVRPSTPRSSGPRCVWRR